MAAGILATLAQLSYVPEQYPRLRIALHRTAYSGNPPTQEQIQNGQVFCKAVSSLTHLQDAELKLALDMAEKMLEHWHLAYKKEGAFAHMLPASLQVLWSQAEPKMASCLLKRGAADKLREALEVAWLEQDAFIRTKEPTAVVKLLTELPGGRTEEKTYQALSEENTRFKHQKSGEGGCG